MTALKFVCLRLVLGLVLWFPLAAVAAAPAAGPRPNFVVILSDDLGYGDLGCYGSTRNRTPNIDRLAAEGVRFTDYHSNGPMCTATRAALLTGLYQHRFGRKFEGALGGRAGQGGGLPLDAFTLAEALKTQGYATGIFGKWHLGYEPPFLPTRQGFDEFRGLVSGDGDHHTHRDRAGGRDWWHNETQVQEEGYTAELLTRHSISFIERNKDRPFFLYVPHLAIHFPWQGPKDPPHRTEERDYEKDKWGLIPDPANVAPHVKAMVEALDTSVGEIMATLRRLGLDERTMVIFASDNGGYNSYGVHQNISSNGPLRGQKTEVFEGGHRVPGIARWAGRIAPRVSSDLVAGFDLFATFLPLAGLAVPRHDGIDLAPLLFSGAAMPERTLFWRIAEKRAVRQGPWKLVQLGGTAPVLFDLNADVGETKDLAGREPDRVGRMQKALAQWEADVARGYQAGAANPSRTRSP